MSSIHTGELLDLVGEIYDCSIAPAKWPPVLARMTELMDANHAAITINTFNRPRFVFHTAWNTPPGFEEAMRRNHATNPFISAALYAHFDVPISAFRFVGVEEVKRSAWYRQTLRPIREGDAAMLLLARSVSQFGSLSIHRKLDQPVYDDDELSRLRPLAAHVRRAVMIGDMLDTRSLERDTLAAVLDQLSVGVVPTDQGERIAHTNTAADSLLQDASAVYRSGDRLSARDPASARDLSKAIAVAAAGTTLDDAGSSLIVSLKGTADRDLVAWVLPLDRGLRQEMAADFSARVAIFVRDMEDTSPFPAELFVRRYGITPAESRVMMLLVQGMTVSEIADNLGISIPTAKTHLARLLAKTGTSRQADLVRLAMSALAPAKAG